MNNYSLSGITPKFPESGHYWVAPDANLIGNVRLGERVSIWFGATLRGDNESIVVADGSNIQEGCILHTDMGFPLAIETDCTIGHKAILHGCTVKSGSLIGMGATLLNGSVIGENSIVGAGSLITEGKKFVPKSLIMGVPGKFIRQLTDNEVESLIDMARHYQQNISRYQQGLKKV